MFVGQRGLFSFTPMLIFAFIGMAVALKQGRQRGLIAAVAGSSFIFAAYLILRTDNFGGSPRRAICALVPICGILHARLTVGSEPAGRH
jgi:hypothetical protein